MRITIEREDEIYSVEFHKDSEIDNVSSISECLFVPVLRALGYKQEEIDEVIKP